ncbi:unnamed protein product, partial [Effrenium voratum]
AAAPNARARPRSSIAVRCGQKVRLRPGGRDAHDEAHGDTNARPRGGRNGTSKRVSVASARSHERVPSLPPAPDELCKTRAGPAKPPGPASPGRRARALRALAQMVLQTGGPDERPAPRARAGDGIRVSSDAESVDEGEGWVTAPAESEGERLGARGAELVPEAPSPSRAVWTRRGPPDPLPPADAPRSWLYVPLPASWMGSRPRRGAVIPNSARSGGIGWLSCAGSRRAPPSPERPPHTVVATRGVRWHAACTLPMLVAGCRSPDAYLQAPLQEALLQRYGGASMAAEIAGAAGMRPALGRAPAASRPRDRSGAAPRETDAEQRATPPPAAPTQSAACDPLVAMREVDLVAELRRRVYTLQAPPGPIRGALKNAMRAGLAEAQRDP